MMLLYYRKIFITLRSVLNKHSETMRLKHLLFILFVASVLQIPFSLVNAQEKDNGFMVQVRTDKGEIPVRFHEDDGHHVVLGYGEFHHPVVPVDMKGEIFIPDSVTTPEGHRLEVYGISRGAFQGCKNLTKIHLPNTIRYISDYSFQDCSSLREIALPALLKTIYPMPFHRCDALRRIIMRGSTPPFIYAEGVFDEESIPTMTIVCPFDSSNQYHGGYFTKFRYYTELIPLYSEQQQ